mgnify:CR=1 FL=1
MDFSSIFKSGLGGAAGGTAIGGPMGAFVGGLGGAGIDLISQLFGGGNTKPGQGNALTGSQGGIMQIDRFKPEQQQLQSQLGKMGLEGLQNPTAGFAPIGQRARSQFNQTTVPGLAERFASSGSNALSSPSYISQLGEAGAGLEEALAALEAQYGLSNQGHLRELLGMSLADPYISATAQAQPGFLQQILPSAGKLAALTAGNYWGGDQNQTFGNSLTQALKMLNMAN